MYNDCGYGCKVIFMNNAAYNITELPQEKAVGNPIAARYLTMLTIILIFAGHLDHVLTEHSKKNLQMLKPNLQPGRQKIVPYD